MARKPNILIIMVDQLTGTLFEDGPADFLHAPNLKALAARSVRFARCYTASPLCAPARASFMSGQMPSRTRVYDNAAEFASSIPTFAHHLRGAGYHTCLSGKMHFVGPDQLHGFEERLTTDIYPADFGWTPDYRKPGERIDWWYHNMGSVTGAGVAEITNQLEYDDDVAFQALQKIYDFSRGADDRPWCLAASFTHPHDPFVARRKYWDLYADCEHLLPAVGELPEETQDPHSRRILKACDRAKFTITQEDVRRSRRAYFANISYLDDKIGELLSALASTRQAQNTAILFTSDHGEMLGERGMWFKMSFLEGSARVPLMLAAPGLAPRLVHDAVSTVDVAPTLCDFADVELGGIAQWLDGQSLLPLATGGSRDRPVVIEYAAEASVAPMVSIVRDGFKFNHCEADPPQLFELEADPHELNNLARDSDPAHAARTAQFMGLMRKHWNMERFDAEVRESQARRLAIYPALRNGAYYPWDFQPLRAASERYMRNHMNLDNLEESKRFPRGE
jgi:choline-sulfatase